MEADWEIELGGEAPVIDACWPGFVDLRLDAHPATELDETKQHPALAEALIRLNAMESPVWTSKCDVWQVADFDRYDLDAPAEAASHAIACYIDLLPRSNQQWIFPKLAIASCESICACLHGVPLRCCRTDFIIRHALITPDRKDLGITAYLTACGSTRDEATAQLEAVLMVFADAVSRQSSPAAARSKLQ
jgi:hypothetical protein